MAESPDRSPDALPYGEARWERSNATPRIDDRLVRDLLRPWPELAARPWRLLPGGLRTLNLQVGRDVVLRASLAPEHDLAKEAALLRSAADVVRVPCVFDVGPRALLLEYVAHEELLDTPAAGTAAGRAAARIHRRTFARSGFLDARLRVAEPFPDAWTGLTQWGAWCLGGTPGSTLGALAGDVRRAWNDGEAALREATAQPVLVHADFKPANVKWSPADRDVVVFDWEFAWAGPALMDVGQMFRWGTSPAFAEAFADAYRGEGGVLPEGWRRTGALLDLFNLVGLLDHDTPMPIRDKDLVDAILRTVKRRRGDGEPGSRR